MCAVIKKEKIVMKLLFLHESKRLKIHVQKLFSKMLIVFALI